MFKNLIAKLKFGWKPASRKKLKLWLHCIRLKNVCHATHSYPPATQ